MPKFCPTCGSSLPYENSEICPKCGVRIQAPDLSWSGGPHPVKCQKSPGIAALLSLILTGLGQVYNGDFIRGALFLMGTFAGILFFFIPGVIVWTYQIYDAFSTAKKMNAGEIPFKETNATYIILYILLSFVAIIIFIFLAATMAFIYGVAGSTK